MAETGFDLFVGIDWSGAKGLYQKGIQVAVCGPGDGAPELLGGPGKGGQWSRQAVLDWLLVRSGERRRWLAGIDFAFSYGVSDAGEYFPGLEAQLDRPVDLWRRVEEVCSGVPDLYGAPFYQDQTKPYWRYYLAPGQKGDLYDRRPRLAEQACADVTVPNPVFKCVGQANVGTGSLAGMRVLHRLQRDHGDKVAVWPFMDIGDRSVVLEIFPRLYFKLAAQNPTHWSKPEVTDAVLAHFASAPTGLAYATEDQADAVVSCAALRYLSQRKAVWAPPRMTARAGEREGWIFGVE